MRMIQQNNVHSNVCLVCIVRVRIRSLAALEFVLAKHVIAHNERGQPEKLEVLHQIRYRAM